MDRFFESKPVVYMSKFFDMVLLNVIFVISCIPIVTIGAACTALYYTCVKVIRRDRSKLWKEYKQSFVDNFKTSVGICAKEAIRNATVISIHHGGDTIYMLVMTLGLATMFVVGWKFMPLILLIMPSVYTLLISYFMEKVLIQYTPEEEQNASDEDEAASEDMLYTEEHKEKPWYLEGGDKDE